MASASRKIRWNSGGRNYCVNRLCTIASGGSAVSVVHEIDSVLALMDIQPVNPGHVLVIPRAHATYLADLNPAGSGEIFEAGMRVAAGLRRSGLRCEAVNFFLADGDAAGQSFTFSARLPPVQG